MSSIKDMLSAPTGIASLMSALGEKSLIERALEAGKPKPFVSGWKSGRARGCQEAEREGSRSQQGEPRKPRLGRAYRIDRRCVRCVLDGQWMLPAAKLSVRRSKPGGVS